MWWLSSDQASLSAVSKVYDSAFAFSRYTRSEVAGPVSCIAGPVHAPATRRRTGLCARRRQLEDTERAAARQNTGPCDTVEVRCSVAYALPRAWSLRGLPKHKHEPGAQAAFTCDQATVLSVKNDASGCMPAGIVRHRYHRPCSASRVVRVASPGSSPRRRARWTAVHCTST